MKNYTIITDPGIDDLVALTLLYKLNSDSKNTLVATLGNADTAITKKNTEEFISFVAPSWNLIKGSSLPFNGKIEHPWPDYFHGPDGTWGVHPPIKQTYVKKLTSYPKNDTVISLSPMTDAYTLLNETKIKEITVMGGAFNIPGNETKYAETNIAFDTDSAAYFFKNCLGVKVQVVPLDVTRKVSWTKKQVEEIPETNTINIWLKKLLIAWFDNYNHEKEKNFNLHDPLAVYLSFFPTKAKWLESGIKVITKGEKRGQTVLDSSNPSCKITLDLLNADQISNEIYTTLFLS